MHVRNKNNNIQRRSPNVVQSDFKYQKELLLKLHVRIRSRWEQILSLKGCNVPILKRDTIEENHCLFQ